jgi:hypothetical protein
MSHWTISVVPRPVEIPAELDKQIVNGVVGPYRDHRRDTLTDGAASPAHRFKPSAHHGAS